MSNKKKKAIKKSKPRHSSKKSDILGKLQDAHQKEPDSIERAVDLADYYARFKKSHEIIELLKPYEKIYPFGPVELDARFDLRLAFANAELKNFPEVEKNAMRALDRGVMKLDFLYLLTYVKLAMREPSQAIEYGNQFLALIDMDKVAQGELTEENKLLSLFYNNFASAHLQLGEVDAARTNFEKAIKVDPGNHLPYLQLATLFRRSGETDNSSRVIKDGLARCREVQELRMLSETTKRSATISACLMVKNEEKLLPECLDSIRSWVDEIIVVDTGSTDRTVEIARAYGAKIYYQKWENDFSRHRNYSIEQATSDWIFIIDADERMVREDLHLLDSAIYDDKFAIISLNVFNVYGENEDKVTFLNSVRLFKRELNLRYDGIVHNALQFPPGSSLLRTRARIKHLGYDLSEEEMARKFERTHTLLERQLKQDPDNVFALYNFAQLLLGEGIGQYEKYAPKIVEIATRLVELTSPDKPGLRTYYLMGLDQLAYGYFYMNEYQRAIDNAERALEVKDDYLDPMMVIAHAYHDLNDPERSNEYYRRYLKTQSKFDGTRDKDSLILFHPASICDAYYGLAANAQMIDDDEAVLELYEKIYKINPDYMDVAGQLGRVYMMRNDTEKARSYFLKQINTGRSELPSLLGLAHEAVQREDENDLKKYLKLALACEIDLSQIDMLSRFAGSFVQLSRPDEGVALYERVLGICDSDSGALRSLADLYFSLERFDDSIGAYLKLIKQGCDNADVYNNLGNSYYKVSDFSKAREFYRKAVELDEVPSIAYRNLALCHSKSKHYKEAIDAALKYFHLNQGNIEILPFLGDQYSELTDFESAISFYEKYLNQNPHDPLVIYKISNSYLSMGHKDAAIVGLRRALELNPGFKPAQIKLDELISSPTEV